MNDQIAATFVFALITMALLAVPTARTRGGERPPTRKGVTVMSNGQQTRYHAEVKVLVQGKEARINMFADTLAEIFRDMATVIIQFDELAASARREIINADLKTNGASVPTPTKTAAPLGKGEHIPAPKKGSKPPVAPVCATCGANDAMELIQWADKNTGEHRQAWKCQECKNWWRPEGK